MRPTALLTAVLLNAALLSACSPEYDNSSFLSGDELSDSLEQSDPTTCAILRLAREAPKSTLTSAVGLSPKASQSLVEARTRWIANLKALDRVPNIGVPAFEALASYAASNPEYQCGVVDVQILATNDFHGNLQPPQGRSGQLRIGHGDEDVIDVGGIEYLATHMQALRSQHQHSITVAAGDIIGATPLLSALFHDEPTIEAMNYTQLDIAAVGNHEFDEGSDELLRMQVGGCHPSEGCLDGDEFSGANFHYLAANVTEKGSGQALLPPYEIRNFRGARIAFIGMTLENTPDVTVKTENLLFHDEAATVNKLIPEIRQQGVEAIVVLLHEGGRVTGLYNGCEGISGAIVDIVAQFNDAVDVVVTGHTNAAHICDLDGVLVTSAASRGRLITDIQLSVDELSGQIVAQKAQNLPVTRTVDKDATMTALIAKYSRLSQSLASRVLGTASRAISDQKNSAGESALGSVVADSQLAATAPSVQGGAQIALMNAGGIRSSLEAGAITYEDSFRVQPFGNTLVTMTLNGSQILEILEQQWLSRSSDDITKYVLAVSQGFEYRWNSDATEGNRVIANSLRLNGEQIRNSQLYRVTVNGFLAGGGDGFETFTHGSDRTGHAMDLEAFEDYLRAHSPLQAPAVNRIAVQ